MRTSVRNHRWVPYGVAGGLLAGVVVYALAEDLILTTYYPSPRGVYQELRTSGDVTIGTTTPLALPPRLYVIGDNFHPTFLAETPGGVAAPFVINSEGQVGIGTADPASYALNINGVVNAAEYRRNGQPFSTYWTATGNNISNTNTGNVGIGTVGPVNALQVRSAGTGPGAANGGVAIQTTTDGTAPGFSYADIVFMDNTGRTVSKIGSRINTAVGGGLFFVTSDNYTGSGIERLTITPTGDVGIGVANPGARLEIAGRIKITGGSPGANKVLTSDASGLASWQAASSGSGGDSVMLLYGGGGCSGNIPAPCPAEWTQANYACGVEEGNVRTCYRTDTVCQVMVLYGGNGCSGIIPALCPAGWTQADYKCGLVKGNIRTCYRCP
ncbi:MAG: hypothetical protein HYY15_04905 [Candidatus Omnitrophica bacterium]|nr:hypothetical protein [Candidatus Omnitrophota bacterium]